MKHHILAVEDEQDALENLRDILELDGYCVTGVGTLKEANQLHPWSEFSIILLDRKLPDGISDAILPQIHETAPHAGVIVITAFADLNGTITAIRSGAADYLLKPVNPDLLRAAIARVLKMREMEDRAHQAERLTAIGDLLQAAPDAMFQIDVDGRVRLMNEEAERMSGYSAEELLGQHVEVLLPEPYREAHVEHRLRFFERPATRPMGIGLDLFLRRKNGSTVPVDICLGYRPINQQDYVIASVRDISERRRMEEELRQATAAVERAYECIRRDVEVAAQLQRQLLPSQLPATAGIQFAWEYRPCAGLGGDGLNLFWLDDDQVGLYLLDVSGHGVAAALLSVTLARLLSPSLNQSLLLRTPLAKGDSGRIVPPPEVARQLNEWLLANPAGQQYFTFLYGILNVRTRCLRYVSAGHPAMIHAAANAEAALLRAPGFPIGCVDDAQYEEMNLQLSPGDHLVIYSDGLTEGINLAGEQFGVERLQRAFEATKGKPLESCTGRLIHEVLQWTEDDPHDDLSVLALAIE
jgi:sigma-B regulation protein RsbU (phosphoserine phosphatase)